MRAQEFINEVARTNYNTARSIAQDIHVSLRELGDTLALYGAGAGATRIKSEIYSLIKDLRDLGFEYDLTRPDHLVPITLDSVITDRLDELTFKGSECTKDCSGHQAGYNWYIKKGRLPNSHSSSFNKGAALRAAGK